MAAIGFAMMGGALVEPDALVHPASASAHCSATPTLAPSAALGFVYKRGTFERHSFDCSPDIIYLILRTTLALHGRAAIQFSRTCFAVHEVFTTLHVAWFSLGPVGSNFDEYTPRLHYALQSVDGSRLNFTDTPRHKHSSRLSLNALWVGSAYFSLVAPLLYLPVSVFTYGLSEDFQKQGLLPYSLGAQQRNPTITPAHRAESVWIVEPRHRYLVTRLLFYRIMAGRAHEQQRSVRFMHILQCKDVDDVGRWNPNFEYGFVSKGSDDTLAQYSTQRLIICVNPLHMQALRSAILEGVPITIPDFWIRVIFCHGKVEVLMDFNLDAHFDGHAWTERQQSNIQRVYRTEDIDGKGIVFGADPGASANYTPPCEYRFERVVQFDRVRVVRISLGQR